MGFLKRLFGEEKKQGVATTRPSELPADSGTGEVDSQAGTRRELVRMLTRDNLRSSGIPDGWIDSQVLLELGRGGQTFVHLRLVMKHWDERLLKYAVPFQRRLRAEVERFEAGAREWLLSITWQYEVDDQCPYVLMPDPAIWTSGQVEQVGKVGKAPVAPSAPSAASQEEAEMQADLARLFAVRDAHMTEASWEPTGLSALPDIDAAPGRPPAPSRGKPRA